MKKIIVINRSQSLADKKMNELYDELVPGYDKAETKAGEIVRAMCRIGHRWTNDGDMIGEGYGKETCNPAARYLLERLPADIHKTIIEAWHTTLDDEYESYLLQIENYVIDYINANPELKSEPNEDNYQDWRDSDEDIDDTEEDDYSLY